MLDANAPAAAKDKTPAAPSKAAVAPADVTLEINGANARRITIGRRLPKSTTVKLSETEWVRFTDRTSGKSRLCVGRFEGLLNDCPAPAPCGLLELAADECGKNGVALP